MIRRTATALVFFILASGMPAMAADDAEPRGAVTAISDGIEGIDWTVPAVHFGTRSESRARGSLLPALYVSLAALNAFDAYSTSTALSRGAAEANPLMRGIAGNNAALWAVKGSVTAGTVIIAERLWRKRRRAEAIAVMLVSNGVMSAVAAQNASVLRRQR